MADHENIPEVSLEDMHAKILYCLQMGQYAKAEELSAWVISGAENKIFITHFYLGVALQFQGKIASALEVFNKSLTLNPVSIDTMQAVASCLEQLERYEESYSQLKVALESAPLDAAVNANIGAILEKLKKPEEALVYYDKALEVDAKNHTTLINRGSLLINLGRNTEGLEHCRVAHSIHPQSIATLFNLVDALLGTFKYEEALAHCEAGLAWQPKHANLMFKKGLVLCCLKQFDDAHRTLAEAQVIDPKVIENHLPIIKTLPSTIDVSLNPKTLYLDAMYQAQTKCFWQYRTEYIAEWQTAVLNPDDKRQLISNLEFGFHILSLALDGKARLTLARNLSDWIQDIVWLEGIPPFNYVNTRQIENKRIKIGYLSGDFRVHPVGLLTKQMYSLHDREQVEIYAYSLYNPKKIDLVQQTIVETCDVFNDVSEMTDEQIARLINQHEIDILVDLAGYTTMGRTQVMALRPAPVQIAYLGYPNTSGADYIDYAIVDNTIAHNPEHWSECLVRMPHAFSPYDNQTNNSLTHKTRQDYLLPENGIVFCCFNSNYKIEPEIFSCWMRILKAVPRSVLWLVVGHSEIECRLKASAQQQQIDSSRLIFVPYVPYDEHIIRYQLADLFLDTHWHNAHTTAADALWQGLPVITYAGDVISSRLAASLLNALEMPELITYDFKAYEALAFHYATNHDERIRMREKLKAKRYTAPLFDTPRTTKNLESAYKMIWQRYCDGLSPSNMQVTE